MERNKYISPADFTSVGVVANTCNFNKLNQAIEESLQFDVIHVFGYQFVKLLLDNWKVQNTGDPIKDQAVKIVIEGGEYVVPDSNPKRVEYFQGIKKIWLYYAYGKYIHINQFDDSPVGLKYKESQFSTGVGIKEIVALENKYKNMAKDAQDHTKEFLCRVRSLFPEYDTCGCILPCGCKGFCSCTGRHRKLTGFRMKTVEK